MKCKDCGMQIYQDGVYEFVLDQVICHRCGAIFAQTIRAQYAGDNFYENGWKTHFFLIEPYVCPICGAVFQGHEFYCGLKPETTTDNMLNKISLETHPEREEPVELPQSVLEFMGRMGNFYEEE